MKIYVNGRTKSDGFFAIDDITVNKCCNTTQSTLQRILECDFDDGSTCRWKSVKHVGLEWTATNQWRSKFRKDVSGSGKIQKKWFQNIHVQILRNFFIS